MLVQNHIGALHIYEFYNRGKSHMDQTMGVKWILSYIMYTVIFYFYIYWKETVKQT